MNIIFFVLKSLFSEPSFQVGERVNAVRHGKIERSDGYVVAQTNRGVLVDWPNGGTSLVAATELSSIER